MFSKGEMLVSDFRQVIFTFANGYKLSIVTDGYGGEEGLLECAIFNDKSGAFYRKPGWNDDVKGRMTTEEVIKLANYVARLKEDVT